MKKKICPDCGSKMNTGSERKITMEDHEGFYWITIFYCQKLDAHTWCRLAKEK